MVIAGGEGGGRRWKREGIRDINVNGKNELLKNKKCNIFISNILLMRLSYISIFNNIIILEKKTDEVILYGKLCIGVKHNN